MNWNKYSVVLINSIPSKSEHCWRDNEGGNLCPVLKLESIPSKHGNQLNEIFAAAQVVISWFTDIISKHFFRQPGNLATDTANLLKLTNWWDAYLTHYCLVTAPTSNTNRNQLTWTQCQTELESACKWLPKTDILTTGKLTLKIYFKPFHYTFWADSFDSIVVSKV